MDFRVLGPIEILDNGRNIAPTAPKPRQAIALLLLRRNTVVRADEFIDELWGENPPTSAMTTLQTYIYKLRRILMKHGAEDILRTRPGGYMLTVPDSAIDQQLFEQYARTGQELLESGDPAQASEVLGRALALWRGSMLVDVVQGELISSYVTRVEELRFRTHELRIDADLQLGRHRELISELKSLIVTHPLHEHLNASLMLALYRSGRRHEALEVYRVLRHNMIEDLGLEPGAKIQQIHQALLSDPPLEPHSDAGLLEGPPTPIELGRRDAIDHAVAVDNAPAVPADRGTQGEAESSGERPAVPARRDADMPWEPDSPAPRPSPPARIAPPAQLPPDLPDFTGRAALLRGIVSGYTSKGAADTERTAPHITVVTGMPGVGKTAFAVRLAHRLRTQFEDGQLYVELHGSTGTGSEVTESLHGMLRALGVPESQIPDTVEERSKLLRSTTAGRRMLLVVDDAATMADVSPLLPGDPRCAVIVTSRRRLPELVGCNVDLDVLSHAEAIELLGRMIGPERLEQERAAADQLVEQAGRLPLALRCIGSRIAGMPGFPLAKMAEQFAQPGQRLDLLRIGGLDVRSRFDSSYRRLSRLDQSVFRLLSMLPPSGFSIDAVAELLGWDTATVAGTLDRLIDEHLLRMDGSTGEIRYTFSDLTLSYARDRLASALATNEQTLTPDEFTLTGGDQVAIG